MAVSEKPNLNKIGIAVLLFFSAGFIINFFLNSWQIGELEKGSESRDTISNTLKQHTAILSNIDNRLSNLENNSKKEANSNIKTGNTGK